MLRTIRDSVNNIKKNTQVLIIGGGINGIGIFRDLAFQGINVTLIEQGDYCSGSSAASSHMIHGGIRYLENGEFRLVKEAVQERNSLLKTAPHFVKPLKTTIPIFTTFSGLLNAPNKFLTHSKSVSKERGAALIKSGLLIYDSFSLNNNQLPNHEFHGKKRSLFELPELNKSVKYTATYYDASVIDPERLALDLVIDGNNSGSHSNSANYVKAIGYDSDLGVAVEDQVSKEIFHIKADVIINSTGPWLDDMNSVLHKNTEFIGGTKGSHIVVDNADLYEATDGREIFFENKDGRIVLIYPIYGKVMIGTTDISAKTGEDIFCTDDEIKYFFDLVKFVFPDITIDKKEIVYAFSGIRPLPKTGDVNPGFISRDYDLKIDNVALEDTTKLLSVVGGKWTTFRALSEHASKLVIELLGARYSVETNDISIGGGNNYPQNKKAVKEWIEPYLKTGLKPQRITCLLERYGTKAGEVISYITSAEDEIISEATSLSMREIEYMILVESVVKLEDIIYRRTNLAFTGNLDRNVIEKIANIVGRVLDWTEVYIRSEENSLIKELENIHRVYLS